MAHFGELGDLFAPELKAKPVQSSTAGYQAPNPGAAFNPFDGPDAVAFNGPSGGSAGLAGSSTTNKQPAGLASPSPGGLTSPPAGHQKNKSLGQLVTEKAIANAFPGSSPNGGSWDASGAPNNNGLQAPQQGASGSFRGSQPSAAGAGAVAVPLNPAFGQQQPGRGQPVAAASFDPFTASGNAFGSNPGSALGAVGSFRGAAPSGTGHGFDPFGPAPAAAPAVAPAATPFPGFLPQQQGGGYGSNRNSAAFTFDNLLDNGPSRRGSVVDQFAAVPAAQGSVAPPPAASAVPAAAADALADFFGSGPVPSIVPAAVSSKPAGLPKPGSTSSLKREASNSGVAGETTGTAGGTGNKLPPSNSKQQPSSGTATTSSNRRLSTDAPPSKPAAKLTTTTRKPGGGWDMEAYSPAVTPTASGSASGSADTGGWAAKPSRNSRGSRKGDDDACETSPPVDASSNIDDFSPYRDRSASEGGRSSRGGGGGDENERQRDSRNSQASTGSHGGIERSSSGPGSLVRTGSGLNVMSDRVEGKIYCRVTMAMGLMKRWKEQYAQLNTKQHWVKVWADKQAFLHGEAPLEQCAFTSNMALSAMKVTTSSGTGAARIFYRHVSVLPDGGLGHVLGGGLDGGGASAMRAAEATEEGDRCFKFGLDNQADFETWSKAIRSCIDGVAHKERKAVEAHEAMEAGSKMNATDLMKAALSSPTGSSSYATASTKGSSSGNGKNGRGGDRDFREAKGAGGSDKNRRGSGAGAIRDSTAELRGMGDNLVLSVHLLDRTVLSVTLPRSGSVMEACISIRTQLGLKADADYSLYLRQTDTAGRDNFTCLPDILPVEEAEHMCIESGMTIVYKLRMHLPPQTGKEAEDPDPSDAEADAATKPSDGAIKLAYGEAVYNVVNGNYLLSLDNCVQLAGLMLVVSKGRMDAATESQIASSSATPAALPPAGGSAGTGGGSTGAADLEWYRLRLADVLPAQAIAEHKTRIGLAISDLCARVRASYSKASKSDAPDPSLKLQSMQQYLRIVRENCEEYGAQFYFGECARWMAPTTGPGGGAGSRSAAATPPWAEAITTSSAKPTNPPDPVPVVMAVNHKGVHMRPIGPRHTPGRAAYSYGASSNSGDRNRNYLGNNPTPSERLSNDGTPIPWALHPVHLIEVWGVKKSRPCFTYRVREKSLINVEVTSPQFKELASVLHMIVFSLMSQREGKPRRIARDEAAARDVAGGVAAAAKNAAREAKKAAERELPDGWTEIVDPATGAIAYWNQISKKTVFTKPVLS